MWLARRAFVESAGGSWSEMLREIVPHALEGGMMVERPWGRPPAGKVLAA